MEHDPDHANAALATLVAQRQILATSRLRRPGWCRPVMALLLGAGIAIGVLHNDVASVVALPFMLYGFAGLAGIDDWRRIGVVPRRPRDRGFVLAALCVFLAVPLVWDAAIAADRHGAHWALPSAGVAVPLLVVGGRAWIEALRRARLRQQP
jgi:hypothetical protein